MSNFPYGKGHGRLKSYKAGCRHHSDGKRRCYGAPILGLAGPGKAGVNQGGWKGFGEVRFPARDNF